MRVPDFGGDGSCACGTCHVTGYQAILDAVDAGTACAIVVEDDGELTLGSYQPGRKAAEYAFSDQPAMRAIFAASSAVAIKESDHA